MTEYKHFLEEAAKRDHRKIGVVFSIPKNDTVIM
jgi:threonyl-tRNA synthetase